VFSDVKQSRKQGERVRIDVDIFYTYAQSMGVEYLVAGVQ
jgi:hypothetical protein